MNNLQPQQTNNDPAENPLLFWVAYLPGEGENKYYLSNGQGGVRVFKTEALILEYLGKNLPPEVLERVVVHSVQGEIVMPLEEGTQTPPDVVTPAPSYSAPIISTLARDSAPTSAEILADTLMRRERSRRRHGRNE